MSILFSVRAKKTKLRYNNANMFAVIGLGNPGEKYTNTRHNVGQRVLLMFLNTHQFAPLKKDKTIASNATQSLVFGVPVLVAFPSTYMNLSGSTAKLLVEKAHIPTENIIVVHDDVHLPFGSVKISFGKSEGGHNGVASIIQALNQKGFVRVRIGIAQKSFFGGMKKHTGRALSEFVLRAFTSREEKQLSDIGNKVSKAIVYIVTEGVERAMQECNVD
jgi:PTH1 family peptidyl-tRNA hydrolase